MSEHDPRSHSHSHPHPPAPAREGVEALDPETFGSQQNCFGCGPHNPVGFRLQFYRDAESVVAWLTPGREFEGPPGIMHGGLQATLADEVGAWTLVGLRGRMGFTGSMTFKLLRPLRVGLEVEARGRIVRDTPRLITVAVTLRQSGEDCFRGEMIFAIPDVASATRILGQELPAAWKKLCRGQG